MRRFRSTPRSPAMRDHSRSSTMIGPSPADHAAFRDASLRATGGEHSKNRATRVQGGWPPRLIERRLFAAIGLHFGLVWQIGDDAAVGLHPPEVRRDELAQRGTRRGCLVGEALREILKRLSRAKQAGGWKRSGWTSFAPCAAKASYSNVIIRLAKAEGGRPQRAFPASA
jgi:hypothetical protein